MPVLDLHYHANVYRCRDHTRRKRLRQHRRALLANGIDFVAATEHGYKRPLDAYLLLSEATAGTPVHVLPGVEAISAEGVDIIFLFRDEADLRRGLAALPSFEWSMWDLARLKADLGAISIVPHPFSPGRSGVVTVAGERGLNLLLPQADYVETHNGSGLLLLNGIFGRFQAGRNSRLITRVAQTFDLPRPYRWESLGHAVGSDAHFPGQQHLAGRIDHPDLTQHTWFDVLAARARLQPVLTAAWEESRVRADYRPLARTARCVMGEAIWKNLVRNGLLEDSGTPLREREFFRELRARVGRG